MTWMWFCVALGVLFDGVVTSTGSNPLYPLALDQKTKTFEGCFFFMHGGCPPVYTTQSGLTTGYGVFMASRNSEEKLNSIYIKSRCSALPEGTTSLKRCRIAPIHEGGVYSFGYTYGYPRRTHRRTTSLHTLLTSE